MNKSSTESNFPNKNDALQTSNQTIVEKHDDEKTCPYDNTSRIKKRTGY